MTASLDCTFMCSNAVGITQLRSLSLSRDRDRVHHKQNARVQGRQVPEEMGTPDAAMRVESAHTYGPRMCDRERKRERERDCLYCYFTYLYAFQSDNICESEFSNLFMMQVRARHFNSQEIRDSVVVTGP